MNFVQLLDKTRVLQSCARGTWYYIDLGKYKSAVIQFERAVELKPQDAEFHYFLGIAYGLTGNYELSEKEIKRASELGYEMDLRKGGSRE